MYRITKPRGASASLTVENTDTRANIIVGGVNSKVLEILDKEGLEYPAIHEIWNITVNSDVAKKLVDLTMKIKKPIRDQRKPEVKKQDNKKIDAMDVLLGLASYC